MELEFLRWDLKPKRYDVLVEAFELIDLCVFHLKGILGPQREEHH